MPMDESPVLDATEPTSQSTTTDKIRLVVRTPVQDCKHEQIMSPRPNRYKCDECGLEYRLVRKSVLRRRTMLR